jgi:hypothetical protein
VIFEPNSSHVAAEDDAGIEINPIGFVDSLVE